MVGYSRAPFQNELDFDPSKSDRLKIQVHFEGCVWEGSAEAPFAKYK